MQLKIEFHDANPNSSSGSVFASRTIDCDSWDEIEQSVRDEMEIVVAGLSADMGYAPGDTIYASWDGADGCYCELRHVLDSEELS